MICKNLGRYEPSFDDSPSPPPPPPMTLMALLALGAMLLVGGNRSIALKEACSWLYYSAHWNILDEERVPCLVDAPSEHGRTFVDGTCVCITSSAPNNTAPLKGSRCHPPSGKPVFWGGSRGWTKQNENLYGGVRSSVGTQRGKRFGGGGLWPASQPPATHLNFFDSEVAT